LLLMDFIDAHGNGAKAQGDVFIWGRKSNDTT
jgi:hypothetical protein